MASQHEINRQLQEMADSLGMTVNDVRSALSGVGSTAQSTQGKIHSLGQEVSSTAQRLTSFGAGLGKGAADISSMSSIVTGASKSLSAVLAKLGPKGMILGKGFEAIGGAAGYAAEVLDESMSSYQQLSKVGAVTAESVTGLAKQLQEAGIPLRTFTSLVRENSTQLAALQGTAGEVTSDFANAMKEIREGTAGLRLRQLGYDTEEISESLITYADLQRRLGNQQRLNSDQLMHSTESYAKELDLVAKLTGMSREEQQRNIDASLREGRWRSALENVGEKQQRQMHNLNNMMSTFSTDMASGLRDQASGFTQSDAAQKLFRTTGGESVKIMEKMKSGQITAHQAMLEFQDAVRANKPVMKTLTDAVGDQHSIFVNYAQIMELTTAGIDDFNKALEVQSSQTGKTGDKTTEALAGVQVALQSASADINSMFTQAPFVAGALEGLSGAANTATDSLYNLLYGEKSIANEFADAFTTKGPGITTTKGPGITTVKKVETAQERELRKKTALLEQKRQEVINSENALRKSNPDFYKGNRTAITPEFVKHREELRKLREEVVNLDTSIKKLTPIVAKQNKDKIDVFGMLKEFGLSRDVLTQRAKANPDKDLGEAHESVKTIMNRAGGWFTRDPDRVLVAEAKRLINESGRQGQRLLENTKENAKLWDSVRRALVGDVKIVTPSKAVPKPSDPTPTKAMPKPTGPTSGYKESVSPDAPKTTANKPEQKSSAIVQEREQAKQVVLLENIHTTMSQAVSEMRENNSIAKKQLRQMV